MLRGRFFLTVVLTSLVCLGNARVLAQSLRDSKERDTEALILVTPEFEKSIREYNEKASESEQLSKDFGEFARSDFVLNRLATRYEAAFETESQAETLQLLRDCFALSQSDEEEIHGIYRLSVEHDSKAFAVSLCKAWFVELQMFDREPVEMESLEETLGEVNMRIKSQMLELEQVRLRLSQLPIATLTTPDTNSAELEEKTISDLNQELVQIEVTLASMMDKFGPRHPNVVHQRRKLEEVRKMLAESKETLIGEKSRRESLEAAIAGARLALMELELNYGQGHPDVKAKRRELETLTKAIEELEPEDADMDSDSEDDSGSAEKESRAAQERMGAESIKIERDSLEEKLQILNAEILKLEMTRRDVLARHADYSILDLASKGIETGSRSGIKLLQAPQSRGLSTADIEDFRQRKLRCPILPELEIRRK